MAHELDQTTGKAAMAYFGEVPWHGLGVKVDHAMNAEEVIKLAGLDWVVGLETITLQTGEPISDYKAVVRNDTKAVLSVVGGRYAPMQNRDAVMVLDSLTDGVKYHTAGSLKEGRKIWVLAKLPGNIRVIGDDVIEKYLLLTSSHDETQKITMKFTPVRVVCNNTLQQAMIGGSLVTAKHTVNADQKLAKVKDLFIDLERRVKEQEEMYRAMALKDVNQDQVTAFLQSVLNGSKVDVSTRTKNVIDVIRGNFETGRGASMVGVAGTAWGLYNAVTEYADHQALGAKSQEQRLDSIWFGAMAKLKERAFDAALTLTR